MPSLDPYLIWSIITGAYPLNTSSTGETDDRLFKVLVELRRPNDPVLPQPAPGDDSLANRFFASHTQSLATEPGSLRYRTGLVGSKGLIQLLLESLDPSSNVERFEVAGDLEMENVPEDPDVFENWPSHLIPSLAACKLPGKPAPGAIPPLVVVVDDRCNFASTSLRSDGRSRVEEVWIQGAGSEALDLLDRSDAYRPAMSRRSDGSYVGALEGRRLRPSAQSPEDGAPVPPLDLLNEPQTYKRTHYMRATPHASHGSAVLDLLAGNQVHAKGRNYTTRKLPPRIRFVQLPIPTVNNTHGGALGAYLIDAILDAMQNAEDGQDVIVNCSFGTHSGGHDGTSLFECAVKELLESYDGSARSRYKTLHVVLPAGNSHLWRCHASNWCPVGRPNTLSWKTLPDDDTDNFVEVWVPRGRVVELTLRPPGLNANDVKVKLDPRKLLPNRLITRPDTGAVIAAVLAVPQPVQSSKGSLFLVAATGNFLRSPVDVQEFLNFLARDFSPRQSPSDLKSIKPLSPKELTNPDSPDLMPHIAAAGQVQLVDAQLGAVQAGAQTTVPTSGDGEGESEAEQPNSAVRSRSPNSPHGLWQIKLEVKDGQGPVLWHAWVQRGDTAPMRGRSARGVMGRQSYFVDDGQTPVDPMFTLNGVATATHCRLHVVGAMYKETGSISDYSGAGPARDVSDRPCGPDVVVPGDESRLALGLLVQGVYSGSRTRVSGTSVAAPTFARLLYESLLNTGGCGEIFGPSPDGPTSVPAYSAGAPRHADPFFRGEPHRIRPTKSDGSL